MIETLIDKTKTASVKTDKFGEIFFPSDFTGKIFEEEYPDNSHLWWVEGDLDLARIPNEDEIARLGGHYLIRSKSKDTVYMRCLACMKETIATVPRHERAIHGYFMENKCSADDNEAMRIESMIRNE